MTEPEIREWMRQRLIGWAYDAIPAGRAPPLEVLEETEWPEDILRLCRNRLILGGFRYGLLGAPGKPKYDRIADAIRRLTRYQNDPEPNLEDLLDAINLIVVEAAEGRPRLKAVDDGVHSPVRSAAE